MVDISIHAPRAGGDRKRGFDVFAGYKFQSTLPVRGAMPYIIICQRKKAFQSTLPVRGATSGYPLAHDCALAFQSTLPVRGATLVTQYRLKQKLFQSTPPVRGATNQLLNNVSCSSFQSTPPVRGATLRYTLPLRQIDISIHAPLAGGVSTSN